MSKLNSTPPSPSPDPHRGLLSWKGGTLLVVLGTSFLACSRGGSGSPAPEAAGAPLQITAQPQAATAGEGGTVTFTVAATGAEPLNFLWLKDDSPLVNAREASLTLTDIKAADAGSYRVHVISGRNRTLSDAATLVVQTLPVIQTQPKGAALMEGEAASLSVGAAGLGLKYQWYKGDEAVAGAQGPVLEIKTAGLADAGSYQVEVSNLAGKVKSDPVALEVSPNPAFRPVIKSFTPSATSILKDGKLTLAWDVAGATEISIEPGVVKGATEAQGSVEVAPGGPMTYTLKASNGSGTISQECSVSVLDPVKISWLAAADPILPWGGTTALSWGLTGNPLNLHLLGPDLDGDLASDTLSAIVKPTEGRPSYTLSSRVLDQSDSAAVQVTVQGILPFSGGGSGAGWKDGSAREAGFNAPGWAAADADGTLFVTDARNNTLRKVAPDGTVTTLAGKAGERGSKDGKGEVARFNDPAGIAIFGNYVYVADSGNSTIRRIAKDGSEVMTFAGKAGVAGSTDGAGEDARFQSPMGLAFDKLGNLYLSDSQMSTIRKIDDKMVVSTVVAPFTGLRRPAGLAVVGEDLYVADTYNRRIRRIDKYGNMTTVVTGLTSPQGLVPEPAGSDGGAPGALYVADATRNLIYRLDLTGATLVPMAGKAYDAGYADGPGASARFRTPMGLSFLPSGELAVADFGNNLIRKLSLKPGADPMVETWCGNAPSTGVQNGPVAEARFNNPKGIVRDAKGNLLVADSDNHVIRRVTPEGMVETLAGKEGTLGMRDGKGAEALFDSPQGLALDASGTLYVADRGNHAIRTVTQDGVVGTYAGSPGAGGAADGPRLAATFRDPFGLALNSAGDLFVADWGSGTVRKIAADGTVSTIAGQDMDYDYVDGPGVDARFSGPAGIAVDADGQIWVSDNDYSAIRLIDAKGIVSSVVPPGSEEFKSCWGLAALPDGAGVLVADDLNGTIKRVSPAGKVSLVAGNPDLRALGPGPLSGTLDGPSWITLTPEKDLLVTGTHAIVRVVAPPLADAPQVAVESRDGKVNDTVLFKAEVSGRAPFTYLWQVQRPGKAPESLPGETKAYLVHQIAAGEDGTTFKVTVTDGDGKMVISSPARLTVLP